MTSRLDAVLAQLKQDWPDAAYVRYSTFHHVSIVEANAPIDSRFCYDYVTKEPLTHVVRYCATTGRKGVVHVHFALSDK